VYRERREYIYFFVANEWLGYCTAVGLILNMGKGENIWILVQALCPSLIGTVATVPPQLPCGRYIGKHCCYDANREEKKMQHAKRDQ
jgi:hypothetical protein